MNKRVLVQLILMFFGIMFGFMYILTNDLLLFLITMLFMGLSIITFIITEEKAWTY